LNIFNRVPQRAKPPPLPTTSSNLPYKYKSRFAMLGTVGSGKSTVAAGIILTAQTLSGDWPDFYCQVIESNSDILLDASNLRRGRFPGKTNPYQPHPVESGILLIWGGVLGEKKVQVPICDIAGEDVQQMIRQSRRTLGPESFNANVQLLNYIRDADAFLLCVPASRALMFYDDEQIEREPSADTEVGDPDVPVARILNDVINYKAKTRGKPINAIGVIITKWDLIAPYAARYGMDLYDPTGEGLTQFMKVCFPATAMTLKPYIDKSKVKFFPSHFQVQRDSDGIVKRWGGGGDRIDVIQERTVPRYREQSYVNLFEWLRSFAT